MSKKPTKKELLKQVQELSEELESRKLECNNYVNKISELNKQNFEFKELLGEYKEETENYKKNAPSPARAKKIHSHLQKWGAERIQALYRGRLARKETEQRIARLAAYNEGDFGSKYEIEMSDYEYLLQQENSDEEESSTAEIDRAALKIQAIQRGRKARIEVQEIKEQTSAVNKIAAIQRGRKSRAQVSELKEQTKAALKIQAIQRGRMSRSPTRGMSGLSDDDLSSGDDEEEENEEIIEQTKAVNKIAAIQRGRKARREVKEIKEQTSAVNKIAAIQRGRKARIEVQEKKEQTSAVNKIAAIQRGRKSRAQVSELKEQTKAAVKIQAIHRGRMSRSPTRQINEDEGISDLSEEEEDENEGISDLSESEEDEDQNQSPKRIKSIPFKILSKEEMESHQHVVAHHVGKIVNHNGDVSSSEDESILSDSGSDQDF